MRNHYIPRFILSNFVRNRVIHVHDKQDGKTRPTNEGKLFVIRDFYQDDLERLLGEIEGTLSADLNSMLTSCRTGAPFRIPISRVLECCRQLLLLQLARTPYAKKVSTTALDEVGISELLEDLGVWPK